MKRVRGPSFSSRRSTTEHEFAYSVRMPQYQFERDHATERYADGWPEASSARRSIAAVSES